MKARKETKEKEIVKQKKHIPYVLIGVIGCVLVVCIAIGIYFYMQYLKEKEYLKPVVETHKSLVTKLPKDIKKNLQIASPSATLRVPILLYHYVEYVQDKKDKIRQSLNINPDIFEAQVKTLSDAHYTFMTAKELGEVLDGKMVLPPNPVLLTFDDGHWDFATVILPILEKYHAKATQYVIPGFTGGSDFMSQAQVAEIAKNSLVDVGAHTVHHVSLKGLPAKLVEKEVQQSKEMLEDTYHIHVVSFAYPNGSFDTQAANIVKDSGFTTSVSTVPGIEQSQSNRFFLFRIRPGMRTGQVLLNYLQQSTFRPY